MARVSITTVFAGAVLLGACSKNATDRTERVHNGEPVKPMQKTDDIQAVRNDRIQFATMRPRGSTMPTLDRQVVLTGPPEVVALADRGDVAVLDELIALLADPERVWAAEVVLAALTGREADIVNSFQGHPAEFVQSLGQGALDRWRAWLGDARGKLHWDASHRRFVEK
jgi:hypothetical protein